jgi:hypothetical protein
VLIMVERETKGTELAVPIKRLRGFSARFTDLTIARVTTRQVRSSKKENSPGDSP